jgi:type II secretory pathway component PulJ
MLTAIFGPAFLDKAASALDVQESRIRFWINPEQDKSPHRSSKSVQYDLESLFMERVQKSEQPVERVDEMARIIEYLHDLIDRAHELVG